MNLLSYMKNTDLNIMPYLLKTKSLELVNWNNTNAKRFILHIFIIESI